MFNRPLGADGKSNSLSAKMQADEKNNKISVTRGRYVFSQEEYQRIMLTNQGLDLPGRIQEIIIPHSIPEQTARIFYLYWTETKHIYPIRISFTCQNDFYFGYSRFLSSDNFHSYFPGYTNPEYKSKLKICTLRVEELGDYVATGGATVAGKKTEAQSVKLEDKQLLFMWFTMDGFLGELRTFQGGRYFSATDVMSIYHYFAGFLRLDNTYLCDTMMLQSQDLKVAIPLRLIAALATDKTWFQHHIKGVVLVDETKLTVGNRKIYQFTNVRQNALRELQAMTLINWHDMLDVANKLKLINLCRKTKVNFKLATLADLAQVIYEKTQQGSLMTDDLHALGMLLAGNDPVNFDNIPLFVDDPAKSVKSNVHQLLWGSYLWRQVGVPKFASSSFVTELSEGENNECINRRL